MTDRRPIAALTELRGRIQPDDTTIPVIATSPFTVQARKKIGDEYVLCSGFDVDAFGWPVMTGCQRGLSPEEGGVAARSWPGGTPVSEVPWTTTEGVPALPAVAEEGRSVEVGGITYFGQDRGDGVIQWVALNDVTVRVFLTISGGVVTLPRIETNIAIVHLIADTEGGAATDDLHTIDVTGVVDPATILIVTSLTSSRQVILQGTGGNLFIGASGVYAIDTAVQSVTFSRAGTTAWKEIGRYTKSAPDIPDFTNAQHDHSGATEGGALAFSPVITSPANGDGIKYNGTDWVNEPVSGLHVHFFSRPSPASAATDVEWTNMLNASTELFGADTWRRLVDLTYLDRFLFSVDVSVAGAAAAVLSLEYSTNITTPSWTALTGSSLSIASATRVHTGWQDIPAGAKALVLLRVVGSGGNGTADPRFVAIFGQCR